MSIWLAANWPAADWIKAGTTKIGSGYSPPPFSSLNLAEHVGDKIEYVEQNRRLLEDQLQLPAAPLWLQQVHQNRVIDNLEWHDNVAADACITGSCDTVCAVLTADCLPLLLCDRAGTKVAAVHIGWRGLCANIIDAVLSRFDSRYSDVLAWIGPHIHQENYEVGEEVREACLQVLPEAIHAFKEARENTYFASLESMVRHQLTNRGVSMIFAGNKCTFAEQSDFFSYRRNRITGRMASLIWMNNRNS